jgi:hypothetical protein
MRRGAAGKGCYELEGSQHGIDGFKVNVLLSHGIDQLDFFVVFWTDLGDMLAQKRKDIR